MTAITLKLSSMWSWCISTLIVCLSPLTHIQPRIVMLNDLRTSSIFFFLDPEYEHSESINFLKSLNLSDYCESTWEILLVY
jgi:hypothetical protein